MLVWTLDASASVVGLWRLEEPAQQRLSNRIASHSCVDAYIDSIVVSFSFHSHRCSFLCLTHPSRRVVSGMTSSALPSASTSSVAGRLNRSRDAGSLANEIKWPELLDKFKQTQEKSRRRNERLLRGADPDSSFGGGGGATGARSLLDDGGADGRSSRASLRDDVDGKGPGTSSRGGNGLGRPLSMIASTGGSGSGKAGGGGLTVPGAAGTAGDRVGPHKRGHSLAGGFGKFASGIARAGSSRDRDRAKK